MERTFSPMIRQYSAIDGLQKAYTLVYAMEVEGTQGCRLTLCRLGSRQRVDSQYGCGCAGILLSDPALFVREWSSAGDLAGCCHRADGCRPGRRERRRLV